LRNSELQLLIGRRAEWADFRNWLEVHLRATRYGGHASHGLPTVALSVGKSERRLAERVGFEPTVGLPLHTLSKRAPSTTRTSLRSSGINSLQRPKNGVQPDCEAIVK